MPNKYNFDKRTRRRGTGSMKWDEDPAADLLPLWVADMDFEAAPAIVAALRRRVSHKIFGYTLLPPSYYSSVVRWCARRHNFSVDKEWIIPIPGVVAALSCVVKALTSPGDSVLVLTPSYNCFFSSIRNNGCNIEASPLVPVGDSYVIDYTDLAERAAKEEVRLCLFCNPHNPVGRVWHAAELQKVRAICEEQGVILVSDEIHGEIVMPGNTYLPLAKVAPHAGENITLLSPTKGFNIAGLQIANILCDNPSWRQKIWRAINDNEVCDLNPFGIVALQAAYDASEEWLDAVNAYIYDNYRYLCAFFEKQLPTLRVCVLEGTYLVWVDVSSLPVSADTFCERAKKEGKVWVNSGTMYGDTPRQHIRINIACPRRRLATALQRIAHVVQTILAEQ